MFIGYNILMGNVDGFAPVSVSNVGTLKHFVPMTIWGEEVIERHFLGYEVVVTYPGDFIGSGIAKRRLTFNPTVPDHFIGNVKYLRKQNITQVTHIFKVPKASGGFFAEDVRHLVDQFSSIMSCKCRSDENIK